MIVFNAPEKLLQDIAAQVGVQIVVATDNAAELCDEREARWIAEWLGTGAQAALAYGDADLGTRFTVSGGEVMELDTPQPEADDDEEMPF